MPISEHVSSNAVVSLTHLIALLDKFQFYHCPNSILKYKMLSLILKNTIHQKDHISMYDRD